MYQEYIRDLLQQVRDKNISTETALEKFKNLPYEEMGFAKLDHHRQIRQGFPEVIYCPGKEKEQVVEIAKRLVDSRSTVLATRATEEIYTELRKEFPHAEYHRAAGAVVIRSGEALSGVGLVAVVSAGTADIPVAEEAALTAELVGARVDKIFDVGVAGIHRLLTHGEKIRKARVVVVVAGMEGALASVVGGLVERPVVAVPTSVGYGAHFNGLAPLLTMLNSCATGVTVVNIDNGFGAGYAAALINRLGEVHS